MSEGTKAQYQILSNLKRIDEKVSRIQVEAGKIPDEIATLEAALLQKREEFLKAKETHDSHEKALRKAEGDLKEREDSLRKAEGKMMEVKTNEEYQAAMKENLSQKTDKTTLEDRALNLMNQMEEHRGKLGEADKAFKTFESALNQDKKKLEEARTKMLNELETHLSHRTQEAAKLGSDISDLYHLVLRRVKGTAVVAIESGMCRGCNMKIRPQLYNEVLGHKAIHRCPTCGRILISIPEDDSTPAE